MGIRPNQVPGPRRCCHLSPPVPVEVHDTLTGLPEIARWLCPDCLDETRPPPPQMPPGLSRWSGA